MTSGPVVVTVVEGNNAVATTRQMVGATKSFEAELVRLEVILV